MSVNRLGPQAGNQVTVRPSRVNPYGPSDTWCKPCSAPGVQDGTVVDPDMFNDMLAQLRAAFTAAGIDVSAYNDAWLWRSIMTAGVRSGDDTGTANHIVVACDPPVLSLSTNPRTILAVKMANNVTGPTDITVDGIATKLVKRPNGADLAPGDALQNAIAFFVWDGTRFQLMAPNTWGDVLATGSSGYPGVLLNGGYFTRTMTHADGDVWTVSAVVAGGSMMYLMSGAAGIASFYHDQEIHITAAGAIQIWNFNNENFATPRNFSEFTYTADGAVPAGQLAHVVIQYNAGGGTPVAIYVNGVAKATSVTYDSAFASLSYTADAYINHGNPHAIGAGISEQYDVSDTAAKLGDFYFVDGSIVAPASFGSVSAGVYTPANWAGTFGANGCHLKFDTPTNLGHDSSGNGNDWIVNGSPVHAYIP